MLHYPSDTRAGELDEEFGCMLDEQFDRIARSPQNFLAWLLIVAGRLPAEDRFHFALEAATALYGYIVAEFDDDVIQAALDNVDGVLDFKDRRKAARRNPHDREYNADSPRSFFAARAAEEVHDAQEVFSP